VDDAELDELAAAVVEHLEGVDVVQGVGELAHDEHGDLARHAAGVADLVAEQGREVAAVDVIHDEVAHAVLLTVAVDRRDPRVVEGLQELDLVVELGGEVGVVGAAAGQQQLDDVGGGAVLRVVLVPRQVQAEASCCG
jgi:hypothetical protein